MAVAGTTYPSRKFAGTEPRKDNPDPPMVDQSAGYDARSGASKKTQTDFDTKWGMKDMTKLSGIAPGNPGSGPDASSPNPLDPETPAQRGKTLRRQPAAGGLKASWDMKDANGKGVDNEIGGKVLGEAILSGSAKLPSGESYANSAPVRQPGKGPF